eukprot:TRINITY_DN3457_c0_g1_i2.p1 TRINITY_DN3457_c0_g1~~TRINITY_DN3457_c0_g1_i2.p1  ORF type:complete len:1638 (+),score=419.77 TRINITY_DN3457_c0_g1_i2:67-4980(+)
MSGTASPQKLESSREFFRQIGNRDLPADRRNRALKNVLSKLRTRLLSIPDCVHEVDLIRNLLLWFNLTERDTSLDVDALAVLTQIAKHPSGQGTLAEEQALSFMQELLKDPHSGISQQVRIAVEDLVAALLSIPQPKAVSFAPTATTDENDVMATTTAVAAPAASTPSEPAPQFTPVHHPRTPTTQKPVFTTVPDSATSAPRSTSRTGHVDGGRGIIAQPLITVNIEHDQIQPHEFVFPPVLMTHDDEQLLFDFSTKLRLADSRAVVQACQEFVGVMLFDFPAEVFLQRHDILKNIITLLPDDATGLGEAALAALTALMQGLHAAFRQHRLPQLKPQAESAVSRISSTFNVTGETLHTITYPPNTMLPATSGTRAGSALSLSYACQLIATHVLPLLKRRTVLFEVLQLLRLTLPFVLDPFSPLGPRDCIEPAAEVQFKAYFTAVYDAILFHGSQVGDPRLISLVALDAQLLELWPKDNPVSLLSDGHRGLLEHVASGEQLKTVYPDLITALATELQVDSPPTSIPVQPVPGELLVGVSSAGSHEQLTQHLRAVTEMCALDLVSGSVCSDLEWTDVFTRFVGIAPTLPEDDLVLERVLALHQLLLQQNRLSRECLTWLVANVAKTQILTLERGTELQPPVGWMKWEPAGVSRKSVRLALMRIIVAVLETDTCFAERLLQNGDLLWKLVTQYAVLDSVAEELRLAALQCVFLLTSCNGWGQHVTGIEKLVDGLIASLPRDQPAISHTFIHRARIQRTMLCLSNMTAALSQNATLLERVTHIGASIVAQTPGGTGVIVGGELHSRFHPHRLGWLTSLLQHRDSLTRASAYATLAASVLLVNGRALLDDVSEMPDHAAAVQSSDPSVPVVNVVLTTSQTSTGILAGVVSCVFSPSEPYAVRQAALGVITNIVLLPQRVDQDTSGKRGQGFHMPLNKASQAERRSLFSADTLEAVLKCLYKYRIVHRLRSLFEEGLMTAPFLHQLLLILYNIICLADADANGIVYQLELWPLLVRLLDASGYEQRHLALHRHQWNTAARSDAELPPAATLYDFDRAEWRNAEQFSVTQTRTAVLELLQLLLDNEPPIRNFLLRQTDLLSKLVPLLDRNTPLDVIDADSDVLIVAALDVLLLLAAQSKHLRQHMLATGLVSRLLALTSAASALNVRIASCRLLAAAMQDSDNCDVTEELDDEVIEPGALLCANIVAIYEEVYNQDLTLRHLQKPDATRVAVSTALKNLLGLSHLARSWAVHRRIVDDLVARMYHLQAVYTDQLTVASQTAPSLQSLLDELHLACACVQNITRLHSDAKDAVASHMFQLRAVFHVVLPLGGEVLISVLHILSNLASDDHTVRALLLNDDVVRGPAGFALLPLIEQLIFSRELDVAVHQAACSVLANTVISQTGRAFVLKSGYLRDIHEAIPALLKAKDCARVDSLLSVLINISFFEDGQLAVLRTLSNPLPSLFDLLLEICSMPRDSTRAAAVFTLRNLSFHSAAKTRFVATDEPLLTLLNCLKSGRLAVMAYAAAALWALMFNNHKMKAKVKLPEHVRVVLAVEKAALSQLRKQLPGVDPFAQTRALDSPSSPVHGLTPLTPTGPPPTVASRLPSPVGSPTAAETEIGALQHLRMTVDNLVMVVSLLDIRHAE